MPTDKRTPPTGGVNGWSPDSGPGLETTTRLLGTSEYTVVGRLPWSSNLTFLTSLDGDGPDPLHAVYKPARGEQSLWDFPDGLYRREVAAFALSEALGWGIVPPPWPARTVRSARAHCSSSSRPTTTSTTSPCSTREATSTRLRTMCAFDIVANNADRKSGHVLEGTGNRLWAIDHGLCFHHQPKLRTVIWDFADQQVPAGILGDLERLAADLPDELGRLLTGREQEALVDRAHRIIESGVFPEPLGDRPPYPWPLV